MMKNLLKHKELKHKSMTIVEEVDIMISYPLIEFFPMGGPTKEAEYSRTIQILKQQTGTSDRDLMLALYLMADSGYNNKDLYTMAKIIENSHSHNKSKEVKP